MWTSFHDLSGLVKSEEYWWTKFFWRSLESSRKDQPLKDDLQWRKQQPLLIRLSAQSQYKQGRDPTSYKDNIVKYWTVSAMICCWGHLSSKLEGIEKHKVLIGSERAARSVKIAVQEPSAFLSENKKQPVLIIVPSFVLINVEHWALSTEYWMLNADYHLGNFQKCSQFTKWIRLYIVWPDSSPNWARYPK